MRLGLYPCRLLPNTLAFKLYQEEVVYERHRHRYEINNTYVDRLQQAGLLIAARTPTEQLTETVELPSTGRLAHPWFVGVQFHPEFTSNPRDGHPLFISYLEAALARAARITELKVA